LIVLENGYSLRGSTAVEVCSISTHPEMEFPRRGILWIVDGKPNNPILSWGVETHPSCNT